MTQSSRAQEMARRLDVHAAEAERLKDFPRDISEALDNGDSLGSPLIDLVVQRARIYAPEVVARYRDAEARLAQAVGQIALVVITTGREDLRGSQELNWQKRAFKDEYHAAAGRVTQAEPIVDSDAGSWGIATSGHAHNLRPYGSSRFVWAEEVGIADKARLLSVDDFLENAADPAQASTLGIEHFTMNLHQELDEDDTKFNKHRPYRLTKRTLLLIGDEEIEAAGYLQTATVLIGALEDS